MHTRDSGRADLQHMPGQQAACRKQGQAIPAKLNPQPKAGIARVALTWHGGRWRDVEDGVRVLVERPDRGAALADERAAEPRVHKHAQLDGLAVLGLQE